MDMVCYVVGDLSEIDGMEMGSILFNLLDNAIEATRQNKKVEKKIICNINKEEGATEIFIKIVSISQYYGKTVICVQAKRIKHYME